MVENDRDRELSRDLAVYQRLSERYQAHVTIMWQAPALGLAAEAFLMTVSLMARHRSLQKTRMLSSFWKEGLVSLRRSRG